MRLLLFVAQTAHAQREPKRQAHKRTHAFISYGPRVTPHVIRNVLADEGAAVHVVSGALRIRRHAHSGRHC